MMRYAQIVNNVVVEVVLWDGECEFEVEDGRLKLIDQEEVGIGWRREGGAWIAPPDAPVELDPDMVLPSEDAPL